MRHPERRWKLIKEATGLGRNPQRSVTLSPKDYSRYLNDKLRGICESTAEASRSGFSPLTDIELNQFGPTSVDEVVMLIHTLRNKQCGLDPIPAWLLKKLSLMLAPFLVRLFNSFLQITYLHPSRLHRSGTYSRKKKLDYFNSLLTNVSGKTLHHYQDVLNAAARLIWIHDLRAHHTGIKKSTLAQNTLQDIISNFFNNI